MLFTSSWILKKFYMKQFSLEKVKTIPFQTIQFNISTQFKYKYSLIVKNISISSYSFYSISYNSNNSVSYKYAVSSIQPIDRALSGAIIPGQSWPGSDGNKGVPRIPQTSSITGTSPSDYLPSYLGHSLGGLPLCRGADGVFFSPSQLDKFCLVDIYIYIYI